MRPQAQTVLNQRSIIERAHVASSLLADQQKKHSDGYQKGKQNTGYERGNPMPTLQRFRSSAFLRRSDA
jgi:hypothetical protein